MKKMITVFLLLVTVFFQPVVQAAESSSKTATVGNGALEGSKEGLKWHITAIGVGVVAVVVGLVMYLASTDPATFSHAH